MNNKIIRLYDSVIKNKNFIESQHKSSSEKYSFACVLTKLNDFSTEWSLMDQFFSYDSNNEKIKNGNYYKDYQVHIKMLPLEIIPFIDCAVTFKCTESANITANTSNSIYFFIHDKDGGEDLMYPHLTQNQEGQDDRNLSPAKPRNDKTDKKVKNVDICVPYILSNPEASEEQVYSKLIIKIYNPHYYE